MSLSMVGQVSSLSVPKIAFVTTCKSRLHHLKETLPLLISMGGGQIVVVDYACPDGTGEWVSKNFPGVTLVSVSDDPGFCASRARNLGAAATDTEWLCFIDADIRVDSAWILWLRDNLQPGSFYRAAAVEGVRNKETWGTFVCQKSAFDHVGGYDEVFRGWGGEDDDLYFRLMESGGQTESSYPNYFVSAISHGDEDRTKFHEIKSKLLQLEVNKFYMKAKSHLARFFGDEAVLSIKSSLMEQLSKGMQEAFLKDSGSPMRKFKPWLKMALNGLPDGKPVIVEIGYRRRYFFLGPKDFVLRHRRSWRMPVVVF